MVKNPPANARDIRDAGSIPESERFPGERNSNPLHYSCLENPMDRGIWQATIRGIAKILMGTIKLSTWQLAFSAVG